MTAASLGRGPGVTLGIDVGGTKVSGGVVDEKGQVFHLTRRDTPDRSSAPPVVEDTIVALVADLKHALLASAIASVQIEAVGVGAAGFVDDNRTTVVFAPHLSWRNEPLREALQAQVAAPLVIENDANAAAWAEYRFGAGRGENHLMMITLGTGIGGGIVLNGRLHRGRFGIAGEFGHMPLVPDGRRCECGNRGCWEQYASGNALVREAATMIDAASPLAADLAELAAGEPGGLNGPLITEAARAGDATAVDLLAEIGTWLGVGIAGLAAAFDPGLFVVGGGVSTAGELLLRPAREAYRRHLPGRGYRPLASIQAAELGNSAGLVGAADLARIEVRQDRRRTARE